MEPLTVERLLAALQDAHPSALVVYFDHHDGHHYTVKMVRSGPAIVLLQAWTEEDEQPGID